MTWFANSSSLMNSQKYSFCVGKINNQNKCHTEEPISGYPMNRAVEQFAFTCLLQTSCVMTRWGADTICIAQVKSLSHEVAKRP